MNKRTLIYIIAGLLLLEVIGAFVTFFAGRREGRRLQYAEDMAAFRPDTVCVVDTQFVERPVPVRVSTVDTLFFPADTVRQHDTLYVALAREMKVYEDSLYRAVVSGVKPSLDTIAIFHKYRTVVVHEEVEKPMRHNELYVQIGAQGCRQFYAPVEVGYRYRFNKVVYMGGFGSYDLVSGSPLFGVNVGLELRF